MLARARLSTDSNLEQIIISASANLGVIAKPSQVVMIDQQTVGPLAEQFIFESGSKKQSILIGPIEQLEGLVEEARASKWRTLSDKAAKNGYLPLAVASAFVHGQSKKPAAHALEGIILLEPQIDPAELKRLQVEPNVRFLTNAPVNFAQHLYQQVWPDSAVFGLNATELETLLPPKFAEADLAAAKIVGGANLVARHQAIRLWQQSFDCQVVSRNGEDHGLPIHPL
jgi:hypothetical protein